MIMPEKYKDVLKPEDWEALHEMIKWRWYYTVGEYFLPHMKRLTEIGLVQESRNNPVGDWPAYRRIC